MEKEREEEEEEDISKRNKYRKRQDDLHNIEIDSYSWDEISKTWKHINVPRKVYYGAFDFSNWVIPQKIMCGGYPGHPSDDTIHKEYITKLLEAGVELFVCLMTPRELSRFKPYMPIVNSLSNKVRYLNFEIEDMTIAADEKVIEFIETLYNEYLKGTLFYIHCWGGHGRTGTIVALLLAKIYNIDAEEALDKTSVYHKCRLKPKSRSPQMSSQFDQVRRLVPIVSKKN